MTTFWKKYLSRGLASLGILSFIAAIVLAPFVVWGLLFSAWNWWAESAGWSVIIPVNWKSVVTAVLICWFLRWLVCRKSS
jgi:uncharacterized membrane protein